MINYVGVDIGGTNLKIGILDENGKIIDRRIRKVKPIDASPSAIVQDVAEMLQELLHHLEIKQDQIMGVGVGCPGVIDEHGILRAAANFPTWKDVPLQSLFSEKLGYPIRLCNDADAAVMAEHWVGSAKEGIDNCIMLRTGVGCGIVLNGQLVRGGTGMIEGGHLIVERNGRLCGCSQRGCLEAYSSATAIVEEAKNNLSSGTESRLAEYPVNVIDAKLIFQLASEGDMMCAHLVEVAADYLGFACVNFCRIFDPQMIVLSGGMAESGRSFIENVRTAYNRYTWTKLPNPVRIEKASAGYDAGIIGAAAQCRKNVL